MYNSITNLAKDAEQKNFFDFLKKNGYDFKHDNLAMHRVNAYCSGLFLDNMNVAADPHNELVVTLSVVRSKCSVNLNNLIVLAMAATQLVSEDGTECSVVGNLVCNRKVKHFKDCLNTIGYYFNSDSLADFDILARCDGMFLGTVDCAHCDELHVVLCNDKIYCKVDLNDLLILAAYYIGVVCDCF